MRIISLRPYVNGYTGFIEDERSYAYFKFPRKGELNRLLIYPKSDYADYGHFLGGITRFFPSTAFLKEPVPLESCTISELDRIFACISKQ
ncbi:MAG: hypothetical protein SWQ30_10230 [Thermodesulfobacteriota bacterium]|nr:hypothetical protein [Thermodesulfobacteriota bacterium]